MGITFLLTEIIKKYSSEKVPGVLLGVEPLRICCWHCVKCKNYTPKERSDFPSRQWFALCSHRAVKSVLEQQQRPWHSWDALTMGGERHPRVSAAWLRQREGFGRQAWSPAPALLPPLCSAWFIQLLFGKSFFIKGLTLCWKLCSNKPLLPQCKSQHVWENKFNQPHAGTYPDHPSNVGCAVVWGTRSQDNPFSTRKMDMVLRWNQSERKYQEVWAWLCEVWQLPGSSYRNCWARLAEVSVHKQEV